MRSEGVTRGIIESPIAVNHRYFFFSDRRDIEVSLCLCMAKARTIGIHERKKKMGGKDGAGSLDMAIDGMAWYE